MLLQLDEIVSIMINLCSTANVFLADHRIRMEVNTSYFPKFTRNGNTGESPSVYFFDDFFFAPL